MTEPVKITGAQISAMRLGGEIDKLVEFHNQDKLVQIIESAGESATPVRILGSGTNSLFSDAGFSGVIALNKISGIDFDGSKVIAGGGVNWDSLVKACTEKGLSGIEALSMIPGSVGAAPVQNIGAYGQQLADTFVALEAYDIDLRSFVKLDKESCNFAYRTSMFKNVAKQRYIITSVTLQLSEKFSMQQPMYGSLQKQLNEVVGQRIVTPQTVRDAVMSIRSSKLPDPSLVANCGSFFKLPIITEEKYEQLKTKYPELPADRVDDGKLKVRLGWVLEHLGYKGYRHSNGMGTYDGHAMVLVNYSAQTYSDLKELVEEIKAKVRNNFGIEIEPEPELIHQ